MREINFIVEARYTYQSDVHGKHYSESVTFAELRKELLLIPGVRCLTTHFVLYVNGALSYQDKPLWFDETQFADGMLPGDKTKTLSVLIRPLLETETNCKHIINGPFGKVQL